MPISNRPISVIILKTHKFHRPHQAALGTPSKTAQSPARASKSEPMNPMYPRMSSFASRLSPRRDSPPRHSIGASPRKRNRFPKPPHYRVSMRGCPGKHLPKVPVERVLPASEGHSLPSLASRGDGASKTRSRLSEGDGKRGRNLPEAMPQRRSLIQGSLVGRPPDSEALATGRQLTRRRVSSGWFSDVSRRVSRICLIAQPRGSASGNGAESLPYHQSVVSARSVGCVPNSVVLPRVIPNAAAMSSG